MLHRLILKATKFQLPPPKRLVTVEKKLGGIMPTHMSNRVKMTELCRREQSLFMAGVEAEEKCFLRLKKSYPTNLMTTLFITQPSSDTTFLIPSPNPTNISGL